MSICLHCHKPLGTENPKAKFCSPKCKTYHSRGIKHKPNLLVAEIREKSFFKKSQVGDVTNSASLMREAAGLSQLTKAKPSKPSTPPHLTPEVLATVPRIFPPGLSKTDLHKFLHGGWEVMGVKSGGILGYNRSMLEIGMPWRTTTLLVLEQWLAKSGYDPKLAKGVGYEPPPSKILQAIAEGKSKADEPDTGEAPPE